MRIVTIGAGIIALLVGMGAIMPALAQVRDQGVLPASSIWPYTLGVFLVTAAVTSGACSVIRKIASA